MERPRPRSIARSPVHRSAGRRLVRKADGAGPMRLMPSRPVMILGGIWASVMLIALVALSSLLNPALSNGNRAYRAAVDADRTAVVETAQRQGRIPLWLFGAIILSCTAGSVLVARQAARPAKQRQVRPKRVPAVPPAAIAPQLTPPPLAPERQPAPVMANPLTRSSQALARQPRPTPTVPQVSPQVPVTIVPSEESHPLDWGEASLADTLDLRKQRPISSWL